MTMYERLRINIILLILLISLTPFLLLGGIISYEFSFTFRNGLEEQIKYRARVQANALDLYLRGRAAILSGMADLHGIDSLVEGGALARLLQVVNVRAGGFVDLGVIDEQGRHLAYVGPYNLQGLNYYQQPWFSEVMSKGIYISDVYMGYRQVPHNVIAVRRQENHRVWILRATIDSDAFNLFVREAKVGTTGDAFIINQEGLFQTQPRFVGQILGHSGLDPSLFGEGAVIERKSGDDRTLLFAGSWLKNKDWLLVITQDAAEGMGAFFQTRNAQRLYMGIGVCSIVLITVFTTHLSVRRLEKSYQRRSEIDAKIVQADKLAALGKMAAGIAHEINNPLAVIGEKTGWMEDLLEDEAFKESPHYQEYKSSLGKIMVQVERARKIIHQMLGYARKMEPRLEDVNVNEVVAQTVSFLQNMARLNDIRIDTELQADLPLIAGDQAKLQQVFLNLINNAMDAIGKDGHVRVRTQNRNAHIAVDVEDDGPGIPKSLQGKIFDPFFSTKQTGEGTGLGLWICFDILQSMGGTIRVESEEGKGSTFTVALPIVPPQEK
jgi:two-component system NtrC family sensor kinase